MPTNLHLARFDALPPRCKLFACEVMRGRGHQMNEDYGVILAPAKSRQRRQVIAIEQRARRAAVSDSAEWSVNQFRGEKKDCGRQLRKMKKCTRVEARSEMHTHRIDQAGNPTIVLGAI